MKHILLFTLLFLFLKSESKAQITAGKITLKPTDEVYIIMPDTTSAVSKSYMAVYRKYWTMSKFIFITPDEKRAYAESGGYFMGFTCYKAKQWNQQRMRNELTYMQVNLSLYKYIKSTDPKDKNKVNYEASTYSDFRLPVRDLNYFDQLIPGDFAVGPVSDMDTSAYDFRGNLWLWGPGVLKSYIQRLGILLGPKKPAADENGKGLSIADDSKNLGKLKDMTLYLPDYAVYNIDKRSGMFEENEKDEKELMEKYTYTYEVISMKDLNQKLLENKEEFYYLIYVNDGPRKYVNIINSKTGKIIYAEFSTPSYNFKKGDIKDLMKAIEGN